MIRAAACLHFAVMRPSGCARCKAAARSFSVGHWTHTDGHQRPSKFGARAAPQDWLRPVDARLSNDSFNRDRPSSARYRRTEDRSLVDPMPSNLASRGKADNQREQLHAVGFADVR